MNREQIRTPLPRWVALLAVLLLLACRPGESIAGGMKNIQQGPDLRPGIEDPSFGVPDQPFGGGAPTKKVSRNTTPRIHRSANKQNLKWEELSLALRVNIWLFAR